ncbi:MAG: SH3 domain-containing protein [Clostridiales bacterium]|nr:SH3 domain-containing protein [Clostridiales bacterium]
MGQSKQSEETSSSKAETEPTTTVATTSEERKSETIESTSTYDVFIINTKQDDLRLREKPSLEGKVLVGIPKGTKVVVEEESDGWSKVTYKGKTGWVKSDFLISEISENENFESTALLLNDEESEYSNRYYISDKTKQKATTTTTKKVTTTKPTTINTRPPTPATVYIVIHGKIRNNMTIMKKVKPGESYTVDMAYKDVAKKYPGEPFTIKGDSVINYDPEGGIRNYYMNAYFEE